jgi:hypothetical protein
MKQLAISDKADTRPKRLRKWHTKFLRALREAPSVKTACQAAGISRETAYEHRRTNALFAEQWQDALDSAVDDLEVVAFKLAAKGNPVLLQFLLRCHRPGTYRETNRVEHAVLGKVVFVLPEKEEREP